MQFSFMISWLQNLAGYSSSSRLGRLNSDNSQVIVLQKDKNVARVPSDKLGDVVNTENQNVARVPGSVVNSLEIGELYQPSDSADKLLNAQLTIHASIENIPHEELNKLLLRASQDGNLELVQNLEAAGADVHAQDPDGLNPLHYAVVKGHPEMVQFLVGCETDVSVQDLNGLNPLHYAVVTGHPDVVDLLIKSVANLNAQDNNGKTALHHAAAASNQRSINSVVSLINGGANVHAQANDGKTALEYALDLNDTTKASLLLANGADPTVTDEDGNNVSHQILSQYIAQPNDKLAQLFCQTLGWQGVLTKQNAQGKTLCNLLVENRSNLDINFLEQIVSLVKAPEDNIEGMVHDELQEYFISAMQPLTKSALHLGASTPSNTKQEMPEEIEEGELSGEGGSDNEH